MRKGWESGKGITKVEFAARRVDRFLSDCEISGVLLFALVPSPGQSCSMSATKYFYLLPGGSLNFIREDQENQSILQA
ncbi:hypothetical protein M0804_010905 [Polistes exclamans]|nr:hypothetical protein M0804_010905 [Polistes exclamans]